MRALVIAVAIACSACSTGPGAPPDSIAGSWSSQSADSTLNGPTGLVLTESGTAVSGSASWGGGIYSVTGEYTRPEVALTLVLYVGGGRVSGYGPNYVGKAIDANTMVLSGVSFHRVK